MNGIYNTTEQTLQDIRNWSRLGVTGTKCVGFQQLSVTSTALKLTIPTNATSCTITCTNSPAGTLACRYRMDGTAPTTLIGEVLGDLDTLEIGNNTNLNSVQFISISGTTVLNVHYYE